MKDHELSSVSDGSSISPSPRKSYEKPVLQIYGDLTEITQATMLSGTNDGAAHPNKHFTS
jgi:hypothetical protein